MVVFLGAGSSVDDGDGAGELVSMGFEIGVCSNFALIVGLENVNPSAVSFSQPFRSVTFV